MLFHNKIMAMKVLPMAILLHLLLIPVALAEVLEQGKPLEREIKGGESHTYQINLSAGQYLQVVVNADGIELCAAIDGPGNNELIDIPVWKRYVGAMPVHWIAAETGSYTIRVYPSKKEASSGRYKINIEEMRTATETDTLRMSAQTTLIEAYGFHQKENKEAKERAIELYLNALSKYKTITDLNAQARILSFLGEIYNRSGEFQKALDHHTQALQLCRQAGDRIGEAQALSNIGFAYNLLGENQKALDYFKQALPLRREVGDRNGEAITLNDTGILYNSLGERQKAIDYYNQALPLRRQVADRTGEARTLLNLGLIYTYLGEYQKALDYCNQALLLFKTVGFRYGEARILNNIGLVYEALGERQKSLDYFNQSLSLRRQIGDRSGESQCLKNIGDFYESLGEYQKALDYFNQALPIRRQIGERPGEARILNNIGEAYSSLGDYQKALDYFNQALSIQRQIGDRYEEADNLVDIGLVYNAQGERQKAFDYFNQALSLTRQVNDRVGEASTLFNIAKLESEQNNLSAARTDIEAAIKLVEFIRTNVAGQELRSSYFATRRNYYELQIDILMGLHKASPKEGFDSIALQAGEQSRARSLVELLTESNINIREGVDAKLLEREKSLQQLINDKAELLLRLKNGKRSVEEVAQIEKEVSNLISESKEVENKVRSSSPRYASLTKPEAISLKDIQQQLDPDTLLLEYSLGEKRSYLWLISQTSLTSYELPARKQIEEKAKEFYNLLSSPAHDGQSSTDYQKTAFELGRSLLGPAEGELAKKRLLVVAEGALQYIPFSALSLQADAYTPLILDHEIANLPSVSTLTVQRRELAGRPAASKLLAIFADPVFESDDQRIKQSLAERNVREENHKEHKEKNLSDELEQSKLLRSVEESGVARGGGFIRLLGSRREANAIASLVDKENILKALDFDASRNTATSEELSKYRFIHIATHGLLNSKNPDLSGVVLSLVDKEGNPQKGFLKLNEIYNLKLNADLVVLSGCQTGLGKEIKGEGLVGLTRGFMYAGAKSVVASLWNVQDYTTSELMTSFYQFLLKSGKRPAEALRLAQIMMLKKERQSNPFYWAGFTFQGDWR